MATPNQPSTRCFTAKTQTVLIAVISVQDCRESSSTSKRNIVRQTVLFMDQSYFSNQCSLAAAASIRTHNGAYMGRSKSWYHKFTFALHLRFTQKISKVTEELHRKPDDPCLMMLHIHWRTSSKPCWRFFSDAKGKPSYAFKLRGVTNSSKSTSVKTGFLLASHHLPSIVLSELWTRFVEIVPVESTCTTKSSKEIVCERRSAAQNFDHFTAHHPIAQLSSSGCCTKNYRVNDMISVDFLQLDLGAEL